jgi:3-oxoadipate enol-lactonase / 4-carboxymuconolactone decarboxylase
MRFVNINQKNIHYEYIDNQQDTSLVFINSLGTDFRIWDGVIKHLQNQTNVLRYDKAGHGLSESFENQPIIKDYANDLIGLLDFLKIKKVVIVGLSIGGIIAQYMGIYHPERVEKLVLSNTAPKVGTLESWSTRINIVQTKGLAAIGDTIMKVWFSEAFHNEQPELLKGCKMMLINSNTAGYIQACQALMANDLSESIHKIALPTLCLAGTTDGSTPPDLVKAMADKLPNSKYILIEGVGHIPCMEAPDVVANHILNFIK